MKTGHTFKCKNVYYDIIVDDDKRLHEVSLKTGCCCETDVSREFIDIQIKLGMTELLSLYDTDKIFMVLLEINKEFGEKFDNVCCECVDTENEGNCEHCSRFDFEY